MKSKIKVNVGGLIRTRVRSGKSGVEAARGLHVSRTFYYSMEAGKSAPSPKRSIEIAEYFFGKDYTKEQYDILFEIVK